MPVGYFHGLTRATRNDRADRHLARFLAFVAGAVNAGGFLALRQYTSHMSGIVSAMADDVAMGDFSLAINGLMAVVSFLLGAVFTTLTIRWARRRRLESRYAIPLLFEAVLLMFFGFRGRIFTGARPLEIVILLCFTMGLQNATITKLSRSVIRTTHITGIVTDLGISIGRLADHFLRGRTSQMEGELSALRLLSSLLLLFFCGGMIGAIGFKRVGFLFTVPLAVTLLILAAGPVFSDLKKRAGRGAKTV